MPTDLLLKDLFPAIQSSNGAISNLNEITFVGIDFGTSTTVVSIANRKGSDIETKAIWLNQRLPDTSIFKSEKIPTVIAFHEGNLLIGKGASDLKYYLKRGVNVWYSFKMELGEDLGAKYYGSKLDANTDFTIYSPKDAAILFFKYLKAQIDRYLRENNLSAFAQFAVSIPASFEANQRKELIEALEQNQINVSKQCLIDEPNAAFLSYIRGATNEGNPIKIPDDYHVNVLVFDFGAGTCDISILEVGKDFNGVFSKNTAISRFEKLGGDDIDRFIAFDSLLPQMLEESGFKYTDFSQREINDVIVPKLLKSAEQLKILICDAINLQFTSDFVLPPLSDSPEIVTLEVPVEIDTKKGRIILSQPKIRYSDFKRKMEVFLRTKSSKQRTEVKGQEPFISIFNPIDSALEKANLNKGDIDYVLLIGGSAKNPLVQNALNNYFAESELLIPKDLQTHVSEGAAIHSLVFNGYGKNIIQPITSEPVLLLTKDLFPKVIIPAGTQIPCDLIVIDNLCSSRDGQEVIELPLFVGSLKKMLFNIKIYKPGVGFKVGTPVKLELEINADKVVLARATAEGENMMVELNPFANKELTTEERLVYVALKDFNNESKKNLGNPTKTGLKNLAQTYSRANQYLKAAETYEFLNELYPDRSNYNQIGLEYSKAGNNHKATEFYKLAYENNKNEVTAFNYAYQLRMVDVNKAIEILRESLVINPNKPHSLYELGKILHSKGDLKGIKMIEKAYEIWKNQFDAGYLNEVDFTWLPSCADFLGKHEVAKQVRSRTPKEAIEGLYDEENLTKSGDDNLSIEF